MQDIFDAIVALTDEFSEHHLNNEYAQLARYATGALCRKRPSPHASGHPNTWACGIIYALGFVNFLVTIQLILPYSAAFSIIRFHEAWILALKK